jgi:hypothetical protein
MLFKSCFSLLLRAEKEKFALPSYIKKSVSFLFLNQNKNHYQQKKMDEAMFVATATELQIAQQISDANKKYLALRPTALNSNAHSAAPCFVKIQDLQENFEKQLKQGTDASIRKLRDLCEQQRAEYADLYAHEKARLMKLLK